MPTTYVPDPTRPPRIAVVGVGSNGCRAVEHMARSARSAVEFVGIDTDPAALAQCKASRPIQIAPRLRRAASPAQANAAAARASAVIRATLEAAHLVIIVAGLADSAAIGVAPVVARIAGELGILVTAVVTLPGAWDGPPTQMERALGGVAELRQEFGAVMVVPSDVLYDKLGEENVQFPELQVYIDAMMARVTSSLFETMEGQSSVDVGIDFEDLRTCLGVPGNTALAMVDLHLSELPLVADRLLVCPLLAGADLMQAGSVLLSLRGGARPLSWAGKVMRTLRREISDTAHVLPVTVRDEGMVDRVELTVIATGLPDTLP